MAERPRLGWQLSIGQRAWGAAAIWLLAWGLGAFLATSQWYAQRARSLADSHSHGAQTQARDVAEAIHRRFDAAAGVAALVRTDPRVIALLSGAGHSDATSVNAALARMAQALVVQQIAVVDANGWALASNLGQQPGSPVGLSFADRIWFTQARAGQMGEQFAVGKATGVAGMFFSAPVLMEGQFKGAVVVKLDLDSIDHLLRPGLVWVVDAHGVIVRSSDALQHFNRLPDGDAAALPLIDRVALYQRSDLPVLALQPLPGQAGLVQLGADGPPSAWAQAPLAEHHLRVLALQPLEGLSAYQRERWGVWALLIVGGAALTALGGVLVRLRATTAQALASAARTSLVLDSVNCGLWGQDEQGRCTFINREAARMLGYAPEQLLGRALHARVHHSHPNGEPFAALDCPMNQTGLDGIARVSSDEVLWRRDGTSFPIEYATAPIIEDGVVRGTVVVFNDVSDRLRQDHALREAAHKADAANRAKSQFLANMSHEIRTPMNAVIGFAELAQSCTDLATCQQHVAQIQDSGQALLDILNDILDFSKIEAGELRIERLPMDLHALLRQTVRQEQWRAQKKGLALGLTLPDDGPRAVICDPLRLRQIVLNLLSNALKFTEQGHVHVRLSWTMPDEMRDASHAAVALIEVADSGIGMTAAQRAQLFKPFVQADDSMTRRFGGTGLGLSICLRLTQMLGGSISVSSTPGLGSTFTLRLPLPAANAQQAAELAQQSLHPLGPLHATPQSASAEPAPKLGPQSDAPQVPPSKAATPLTATEAAATGDTPATPRMGLTGRRILLAEDNPVNQTLARHLLDALGVDLSIAADGQQALDLLAARPFDLVLMDIQMPVMDGLEATRRIRAQAQWAQLPVIAMSAGVTLQEQAQCQSAGVNGFIGKPFKAAELRAELSRWLGG